MTDMVEMVARAICKSWLMREGLKMAEDGKADPISLAAATASAIDRCWQDFADDARAAIAAMREPTEAMMQAGCASNPPGQYHANTKLSEIIGAEWQAMIDEALAEK